MGEGRSHALALCKESGFGGDVLSHLLSEHGQEMSLNDDKIYHVSECIWCTPGLSLRFKE